MLNKKSAVSLAIYAYVALPFIIFALGFLKWYFAVPVTAAIVLSLVFAAHDTQGEFAALDIKWRERLILLGGFILIVTIVIMSGIGNFVWQNRDHPARNALFNVLVNYDWPPMATNANGDAVSLVYYIGFWLPSAVVGKLVSLQAGYIFQVIWASVGIFILWYLLCILHKKVVLYPLIVFLLFSGLDSLGHFIVSHTNDTLTVMQKGMWAYSQGSPATSHLEWWANRYQFSSHITQLFWVFNQCIPVWVTTVLLLIEKNNKNLVLLMGLTLLSSTLPFIGLIPIFVWCAVTRKTDVPSAIERPLTSDPKHELFSLFTYQNIIGGGLSGIISFLYLKGNIASSASTGTAASTAVKSAQPFSLVMFFTVLFVWAAAFVILTDINKIKLSSVFSFVPALFLAFLAAKTTTYTPSLYILFVICELLVIAASVVGAYRKNSLLFLTLSCLLIIPFFKVGHSIDFCMRASIPLLVVLCIFVTGALGRYFREKKYILFSCLIAIVILGSVTPAHEMLRTVEASVKQIKTNGKITNKSLADETVFEAKNFIGKTDGSLFFEYLAK